MLGPCIAKKSEAVFFNVGSLYCQGPEVYAMAFQRDADPVLFDFLIMNNQYSKLFLDPVCCEVPFRVKGVGDRRNAESQKRLSV